jgi:hypothetical protein
MFPKNKPIRDKKYRRWIAEQDCICFEHGGCMGDTVHAHIYTGGMGTKCCDYKGVPLCYTHHQDQKKGLDHMSFERFEQTYGVDLEQMTKDLVYIYVAFGNKLKSE